MTKQIKGKSGTTYIIEGGRPRKRGVGLPPIPYSDPYKKRRELAKRLHLLANEMDNLHVPSPDRGYYMDHPREFREYAQKSIKALEAIERHLDKLPDMMNRAKD